MRNSLDHLPERKRQDLAWALKVLFEEFEAATIHGSSGHKRRAEILKVVLFGSYATGKWVADPVGGYFSDYDLLIVVNDPRLTDPLDFWGKADERLTRDHLVTERLSAPVNFIVHDLPDVNEQLRLGRYFFKDVARDGVALYEAPGHDFVSAGDLSPAEALKEARNYFDEWFRSASQYRITAEDHVHRGADWTKKAAFEYHQAVERLYTCTLLVGTLYAPKTHRLNFLRSRTEDMDGRLAAAWPRATKADRRCFELLRRAYVEARYSPHYKVSARELAWIGERVAELSALVEQVCLERLAAMADRAV